MSMGGRRKQAGQVRRRRVFYVPGFDPFPARRYRELYRKEGAAQAAISGYDISQGPGSSRFAWQVTSQIEGHDTQTEIEVLVWSDIVRASMATGIAATYVQMVRTVTLYLGSGAFWRLAQLRKGPVIAALFPVAVLCAQLLVAMGVALGLGAVLAMWHGWAAALAVLAIWPVLRVFQHFDNRIYAHYLMHDYAFSARWGGANSPDLEARIAEFADRVAEALDQDVDEVLIVGHSSGVHVAVSVLADLLRAGRVPEQGPHLGFLSLGQVVPMVSFLPKAGRLRADLKLLSTSYALTWVDVTAPGDGCAFALCDPVAVSGVAPPDKKWPLVLSAAFTKTLSPERWRALRWKFFKLHFQYLSAFDRPGRYDYFQITAGPQSLAARFAGRAPSRSRIERAVNGHTSLAA